MPRTCTICAHAQRPAIDGELVAGLSAPQVAAKYRVSSDALTRHRAHIAPAVVEANRLELLAKATAQLCQVTGEAVEALRRNLACGNPQAEIRAAAIVLDMAFRGAELEELAGRIDELETFFRQQQQEQGNSNPGRYAA